MMVHDHEIGFRGALTHPGDETVVESRAVGADAVLAGGRDLGPEGKILGKIFHLGAVAGLRVGEPFGDALERDGFFARMDRGAVLERVESMQRSTTPTRPRWGC